jgi:hypothetical protein
MLVELKSSDVKLNKICSKFSDFPENLMRVWIYKSLCIRLVLEKIFLWR